MKIILSKVLTSGLRPLFTHVANLRGMFNIACGKNPAEKEKTSKPAWLVLAGGFSWVPSLKKTPLNQSTSLM